jgi:tRNA pseudouridine38-40 synthase
VQDVVEKALRQIGWQDRAIQAAGRTDTGVHATGQVVAFNCDWRHTPQALGLALNAHLPADVAVREVQQVAAGFDPRRHALSRTYHYHIFCDELRDPLKERYAWRVWPVVRLDLLQEAAAALIGLHNFAAFGTPPRAKSSTIREIFQAGWTTQEDRLVFTVTANAFLYHMVRHMVALQVAIGQGKVSAQIIPSLFDQGAAPVQGLAPAAGLFLTEVRYPPQPVDDTQASN